MLLCAKFSEIKKIFEGGILAEEWIHKARFRLLIYKFLFFTFLCVVGRGNFSDSWFCVRGRARAFSQIFFGERFDRHVHARSQGYTHLPPEKCCRWKGEIENWFSTLSFRERVRMSKITLSKVKKRTSKVQKEHQKSECQKYF